MSARQKFHIFIGQRSRHKQYLLPIITDILRKHSGYRFFTILVVSMQYYTFELDEESQNLCTIITPFGKYKYLRLSMGLKCSPDIAQAAMENVLSDIKDADGYIDDVGAFFNDWDHHVNLLATILQQLHENGFTINPLKCEWAIKETDWLGYWLTPQGSKPWKKENRCHTTYESSLQCHRAAHVHWLR
jgi:hypothetical protein